jgi:glycerol-3-phosphate acyltransferase PlsY
MFFIFLGFFSGSILYSYHLPKIFKHIDIVIESDDHNPGTFNAVKKAGLPIGLLCLFLDTSKGFFPVFLSVLYIEKTTLLFAFILSAPVFGHAIAVFYKNIQGGKAIATSFGVLLALIPGSYVVFILAFWYIVFSAIIKIHPNEKRTVITFFVFSITSLLLCFFVVNIPVTLGCFIISAIVMYRNRYFIPEDENSLSEKKHSALKMRSH